MVDEPLEDPIWDAGFDADRALIISRLGLYRRVFPRPSRYARRFHHQVIELPIEDWTLPVPHRELAPGCVVDTTVTMRFQPTIRYAQQNLEALPEIGAHVRKTYLTLLLDAVEEELRGLDDPHWLSVGCAQLERRVETVIHELLALRDIQSRARCSLQPNLQGLAEAALELTDTAPRQRALQEELLRRQRALIAEAERRRLEQERHEREERMALEQELMAVAEQEEALRQAQRSREFDQLRAQLEAEEKLQAEQRSSDARLREEQIRHGAQLRELERQIDQQEQDQRAHAMDDTEARLKREIELLALERQRLLLEEEIRDIKLAKAKGWIINAKKRFPLGRNRDSQNTPDTESSPSVDHDDE